MLLDLAEHWDVPAGAVVAPLESGGYNNHLYRVQTADRRYVLRVYGSRNNPRLIQHELSVVWQLARAGLPFQVPAPILTTRGEWCVQFDTPAGRRLAILIPFVEGANPDLADLGQAEAVGEALGHLRVALAGVNAGEARAPASYLQLERIHPLVPEPSEAAACLPSLVPKSKKMRLSAVLEGLEEESRRLRVLPQQLMHGDVIPGNVLVRDGRVTALLDFEFCAPNPRGVDLACAIDAWCYGLLGSGREWERIAALKRGHARAGDLSAAEMAVLPALLRLRNAAVLLHIIGQFLADRSPLVDVEQWLDSLLDVDAWLTLNAARL